MCRRWRICRSSSTTGSGITSASRGPRVTACGRPSRTECRGAAGRTWRRTTPSNQRVCWSWDKSRLEERSFVAVCVCSHFLTFLVFLFAPPLQKIKKQDTLGGSFDATQAFVGEMANLNIWNRKLSIGEIYNLATCNSKAPAGNVFSWTESNIEIFGGATKWTFEPCRSLN